MACLYHDHATDANVAQDSQDSWVSRWLKRYAQASFTKFEQLSFHAGEQAKIDFSSDAKDKDKLEMVFNEAQDLTAVDKLSQVIVLFREHPSLKFYPYLFYFFTTWWNDFNCVALWAKQFAQIVCKSSNVWWRITLCLIPN